MKLIMKKIRYIPQSNSSIPHPASLHNSPPSHRHNTQCLLILLYLQQPLHRIIIESPHNHSPNTQRDSLQLYFAPHVPFHVYIPYVPFTVSCPVSPACTCTSNGKLRPRMLMRRQPEAWPVLEHFGRPDCCSNPRCTT